MPKFWFKESEIRRDYSSHVLRAMREGFQPMTLEQFGNRFARSFYLIGIPRPMSGCLIDRRA